jgi:hypothetical protein
MHDAPRSSHCQNCGEPLSGLYCAACGQKDEHRILPLKELLHEVFHEILHLDARFLGTLALLLKPGALTLEYLAGRRTRWFPPFRLYLMVSLMFFAVAALKPSTRGLNITYNRPVQVIGMDGKPVADHSVGSKLANRAEEINRDPVAFYTKVMAWLPRVLFLLLPLFALLLKLAYLRTRTLFAVHAIFSLHEHAFAFLWLTVISLLGYVPYLRSVRGLLIFGLPLHLLVAMKRVYRQGWLLTTLKAAVVGVLHLLFALAVLVLTTVLLMLFTRG